MRRRRRRRRSRRRALRPVRPPSRGRVPGTGGRRAGARRRPGFRAAPPGRRRGCLSALRLGQDGPPREASPSRQHLPPLPVVRPHLQPRPPDPPRDPTRRGLTGRGPLHSTATSRERGGTGALKRPVAVLPSTTSDFSPRERHAPLPCNSLLRGKIRACGPISLSFRARGAQPRNLGPLRITLLVRGLAVAGL